MNDSQIIVGVERTYGTANVFSAVLLASWPLIALTLAIYATVRCVRGDQKGLALVFPLMLIWGVPIIGPIFVLYSIRRAASPS